jgi:hypothetical protein
MAMKIHIVIFWVMTLCDRVVDNQLFLGTCCLHFQDRSHPNRDNARLCRKSFGARVHQR